MARNGTTTRNLILETAESLILEQGFAATSVDAVLERASLTKGAFFHHFASKAELAHALAERHARQDAAVLDELMTRAERLTRDPLQQVLVFVGLFEEAVAELGPQPGCLFASYVYEAQLMTPAVRAMMRGFMASWRERLGGKLRAVAEQRPPRLPVDIDSVADVFTVTFEGAFVVARMEEDPTVVGEHLRHYRNYLELLFG